MNEERLFTILHAPHVSEKGAYTAGPYQQYIFKVAPDANKPAIKRAVEHLFKVTVRSVRITNVKSKPARFGKIQGRRSGWKKAYVSLAAGQEIDIAGGRS